MSTEHSECVFVALFNKNAKLFRHIILSSVTSLSQQIFSSLFNKRHVLWKTLTEHKICVLIFSIIFVCNICHSKKNSAKSSHKRR